MSTNFDIRRLPLVGGQFAKIGQVYDTVYSGCTPDAKLFVQAAFAATPYLAISLFKPELIDIDLVRGGRRHHKKPKFGFKFAGLLQPTVVIRGVPGWAVFAFNSLEMAGWYLLVIDASTDFLVNWTSMAYRWGGCRIPGQPYSNTGSGFGIWEHGTTFRINMSSIVNGPSGMEGNATSIHVQSGVNATFEYHLETGPHPRFPGVYNTTSVQMELRDAGTSEIIDSVDTDGPGNALFTAGNIWKDWRYQNPERTVQLWITPQGPTTFGWYRNAVFNGMGQDTEGLLPDP